MALTLVSKTQIKTVLKYLCPLEGIQIKAMEYLCSLEGIQIIAMGEVRSFGRRKRSMLAMRSNSSTILEARRE
jgi:hypothetical protein